MAKYKETIVSGLEWTQLGKVKVDFDIRKPTNVTFNEEVVRVIDGQTTIGSSRLFSLELKPISEKFILVDPDTNLPTGGDMTYRQLEKALYSLYYAEAVKLDQQG